MQASHVCFSRPCLLDRSASGSAAVHSPRGGDGSSNGGAEAWRDDSECAGCTTVVLVHSSSSLISSASFVAVALADPFGRLKSRRTCTVPQLHSADPVWNRHEQTAQ